jgi:hypothetical protein
VSYGATPPNEYATERDWRVIVLGSLANADEGIDDRELERIQSWEHRACADSALLTLVRQGRIAVRWHEDEPEPTFTNIDEDQRAQILLIASVSAGQGADK